MEQNRFFSTLSCLCLSFMLAVIMIFALPQKTLASDYLPFVIISESQGQTQASGWQQKGSQWQYQLSDGSLIQGGWIKDGDGWYYFDSHGIMACNTTLDIEGHTYRFESTGAWKETPPGQVLFAQLPSGEFKDSIYEHSWAGIRMALPKCMDVQTAQELAPSSAYDYIPSYYDFLAISPEKFLFGVMVQYNSDPIEKILSDDLNTFSSFLGEFEVSPTVVQDTVIAGKPYRKIICALPDNYKMNLYLRNQDHKALYLLTITQDEEAQKAAERLMASIEPCE